MTSAAADTQATADSRTDRAAGIRPLVLALAGLIATGASAQSWRVTPSIGVTEIFTDNVNFAPSDRKESDLITQVTSGLHVNHNGGRLRVNLDYRMHNLLHAGNSERNQTLNFLSAVANMEAVTNWLFIDAGATITQQAVSAFGLQPTNASRVNANSAQTIGFHASPYIRGRFGSTADYQLRYRFSGSGARGNDRADTEVNELSGSLVGRTGPTGFGWNATTSVQNVHTQAGNVSEVRRLQGILTYQYDPGLRFSAITGYESNSFAGGRDRSAATYGARAEWTPSPRTQVTALQEKRPFGNSHEISLSYRTPLSVWQYRDRKDITVLPNQLVPTRGTAFELLYDALASRFPDPVLRAQEVERQLAATGIPRDLALVGGFLTTRVFVQRSRQASVAILGRRNTLTFTGVLTDSSAASSGSGVPDDFNLASEIQQRSLSASWGRSLSPLTSLNLLASQVHSSAAASNLESTQTSVVLQLLRRIGPKTSGSLSVRRVHFSNASSPGATENAVTATLQTTF